MRIPMAVNLQSRDGTVAKDCKVLNGVVEGAAENATVWKRAGTVDLGLVKASSTAQYLTEFNGQIFNFLFNTATSYYDRGTVAGSVYTSVFQADDLLTGSGQITGCFNANAAVPVLFVNLGGKASWYNGSFVRTALVGATASWINTSKVSVPGAVFLDGYYFIMDTTGVIWNSNLNDVTTWDVLAFVTAQTGEGTAVALGRSGIYIVAFKTRSIEFFYDAANTPGSPLAPVPNGMRNVGLASAGSLAQIDSDLYFMSQSKQKGRSVSVLSGTQIQTVSTGDVERILNADALTTVYSFGINLDGHRLYVLTLVASNITIVYDADSQTWYQWSSLTLGANKSVTSITLSGTTATVTTSVAHTLNDGDPVSMAGAVQSQYNGIFQVSVISSTVFTYQISGTPASPATGTITATPYTETYFKYINYASFQGMDLLQHETDGHLYQMLPSTVKDGAAPINYFIRSQRIDGGTVMNKPMGRITLIGFRVVDTAMVRWSDDDMTTVNNYHPVDLSLRKPRVRRCGSFERRQIEVRHVGNTKPTFAALELITGD